MEPQRSISIRCPVSAEETYKSLSKNAHSPTKIQKQKNTIFIGVLYEQYIQFLANKFEKKSSALSGIFSERYDGQGELLT